MAPAVVARMFQFFSMSASTTPIASGSVETLASDRIEITEPELMVR